MFVPPRVFLTTFVEHMLQQLLAIARNAYVESVRQPVLLLLVLVSGLIQVFNTMNTGFSMTQDDTAQVTGDTKLMFDLGLGTIFLVGTLLAGFIATAVISREIENKTVLTVVSKPIGRPVLILGKFLGVSGAILGAVVVMLCFLLLAVRHGVMSTAADDVDAPVVVFSVSAVFLSLLVAGWGNFFYGWNFAQTASTLLLPLCVVAYVCVLFVGKEWKIQDIHTDFKDQVMLACLCLGMAVMVLTAFATAASTRLSQVPTILVCLGLFVGSLLNNHLIGRFVFVNEAVGIIESAKPTDVTKPDFSHPGDEFVVRLQQPPWVPIRPRDQFTFSTSPNGYPMETRGGEGQYAGSLTELNDMVAPGVVPALVVTEVSNQLLRVRHVGAAPLEMRRPPEAGDYVFKRPTRVRRAALAAWGVLPNMQFFWLLDAVSQSRPIPPGYVLTSAAYAACQIGAALALAVVLFQKRDVG